ncbi:MAG: hypothetical protein IT340_19395 [Chloroflexi bacterium]|nr:hypothetical protein [Chloroflexota bacterium]
MANGTPTHNGDVLATVRRVARLAGLLLELRDEYERQPRADTLAQIDRRLGELTALRAALGIYPPADAVEVS